jgi:putative ABC transport system permease protein
MMPRNVRVSIRLLLRSPAFTIAAVFTLALAIGLSVSVFSVLNATLIRPLPYPDADRLALIWTVSTTGSRDPVSFDDFEDWRRGSKTIESGALYSAYYKPVLTGAGEARRLQALLVSHQYFTVMSARPLLGRFFLPEEDRDGRDDVVVLSYELWRDQFRGDTNVVGKKLVLNSRPLTIVGVAPQDLPLLPASLAPVKPLVYRPVGEPFDSGSRDGRHLETIVRLRPGVSIQQAQAELTLRCRDMERVYPADAHLAARIVTLRADMTRNVKTGLWALQSAVLALMLIACANIANLLLAKSSTRRRELATRAALGATTSQLAGMLLTESLVLAVVGGVCGLVLASAATSGLTAFASRVLPDAGEIAIDPPVAVFAMLLSLAAAVLFGLAPVSRLDSVRLDDALKSGGRVAGDHRHPLRQALAACQISLALVLLVSAGLLGQSFLRLRGVNPGFDPQGVLSASVALPSARYSTEASVRQFFDRALANMRTLPGVTGAAVASVVPMTGDFDRTSFEIQGKAFAPREQESPDRYLVSPGYLAVMHIPLRAGRWLRSSDDADHAPVCVISETAARLWFGNESPLGHKIRAGSPSGSFDTWPFREVVGVVGDVAQYGLGLPATPQIYMPHAQYSARYLTFLLRTNGDPAALGPALQKAVFAVDPEQPVYDVGPLEALVSNSISSRRLGLWLLAAFALGALALAVVGVYGVVSYSVSQRTSEFGIRLALGARPADIRRQALGESLPMIAGGVAIGILASLASAWLLGGFLFGVRVTDAVTFAALPLLLAAVALAACYFPANRAAKSDPLAALRFE